MKDNLNCCPFQTPAQISLTLLEQNAQPRSGEDNRRVSQGETSLRVGQFEIILSNKMHEELLHDSGSIPAARASRLHHRQREDTNDLG